MPKSIHVDHHDTAFYIPMYHRTEGFTEREGLVYKTLKKRFFHDGRVVDPSYLGDQPNIRPTFTAIRFDCLLDISEKICPVFVLQFYISVRLICSLNGTLSTAFIIRNFEITLRLEEFAHILCVPCKGVSEPLLIREALFYKRPPGKTRKETILSENAVSLIRNKDHPNACLCYMLYCLTIGKPFNLAYYIANRMVCVTKSADMTLPYGMLLTRLFAHVSVAHLHVFSDDLYLVDHPVPYAAKPVPSEPKELAFLVLSHVRYSRLMDEFDNFAAKERESLKSMYEKLTTLGNIMDHNNVHPIPVPINAKMVELTYKPRMKVMVEMCYNFNEKGQYARDFQKPKVRDAKYFREQMFLAMKDEAGSNLTDEENGFMLDNSYGDETLEELTAAVMMMARIQPAYGNAETVPSYDAKAISEVNASSKVHEQVSHVKRKTIIQTIDDDQIDSNIIFDDSYVENNDGTSKHD
nr:hypothetical protein [Tanacetum cinerariifolium]